MSDERVDRGHHSVLKAAATTAAEAMIPVDDILAVDHSRRRLLTVATVGIGAVGVAFAAVPFIASWEPSERAKALGAPVAVDASKLEDGQMLKVVWRGQPVYVVRRSKAVLDAINNHNELLADPDSDDSQQPPYIKASGAVRARVPAYWVGLGVCTHLGCAPLGAFQPDNEFQLAGTDLGANWPGGFYCPCHGSKYDISGRVFKSMPAPKNLTIPPYTFADDARIVIGENEPPKPA
ncbi:MAG TPA: ubiquinol-cytochrome c reductase iron-sulfur subunit [Steroidobacteraceae bacterium]|nr:ubiquinol-cytochrome c reductase iron-sulfur subunit [Steroidobacteraceae bacterium]